MLFPEVESSVLGHHYNISFDWDSEGMCSKNIQSIQVLDI